MDTAVASQSSHVSAPDPLLVPLGQTEHVPFEPARPAAQARHDACCGSGSNPGWHLMHVDEFAV
eukprot:SAG22_NODE_21_length_31784_cov_15.522897_22_plen_64_part_00